MDKAVTYSMSHGVFHWLFKCLENSQVSSFAIGILGALLYSADSERGLGEIGQACKFALGRHSDSNTNIPTATVDMDTEMKADGSRRSNGVEGAGPSAGAKRKRASIPLEQLKYLVQVMFQIALRTQTTILMKSFTLRFGMKK